jgi:hypothetical protein
MSIKRRVIAAAAAMTMAGGLGAVGLLPADAATPSCRGNCATEYGREYGTGFVLDVLRQGEKVGQPVILFRASNSDPAEDFTIAVQGTVATFYADGLVSAALDYNYRRDPAFELEYTPYGVDSGLCTGVGSTAADGTPVALEPCGVSSKTLWVVDLKLGPGLPGAQPLRSVASHPLINGSDTNVTHPFVLQYPSSAYPTDLPRPQLNTYTLQQYSGGAVYNNELWSNAVTRVG